MRSVRVLIVVLVCTAVVAPDATPGMVGSAAAAPVIVTSFAEPAISPDHSEIAFVCGGDVWSVALAGGAARLLVTTGGTVSRPIFSPDGARLAFVNAQSGSTGIAVVTLAGGALTRLTHDDVTPELDGWSADGRFVYFSTSAHNIGYFSDILRVAVTGGTPMRVLGERFVNSTQAAAAPDGAALAYVRDGLPQWWRRGHSHIDQTEIVVARAPRSDRATTGNLDTARSARLDARSGLLTTERSDSLQGLTSDGFASVGKTDAFGGGASGYQFETVTTGDAKDRWPMWSPDASTLYFVSDRSGGDEIWARHDGRLTRLTKMDGQPVLWPTISRDGRIIAFEHGGAIWTYDTSSAAVAPVPIALRGGSGGVAGAHVVQNNRFTSLAVAPDGNKLAFVARGRVFAAGTAGDGPTQLITAHPDAAYDFPVWAPDSRRLAYVVDRGAEQAIATADLPDGPQRIVTPAGHNDDYPHWSPDGKSLAFVRDGRELHQLDLAARTDRVLARGFMDRRPFGDLGNIAFAPAGDWIAYVDLEHGFANVRVVPSHGGEPRAISFLPNANAGPLAWSPDGKRLYVVTSQRTENGEVAQIDLVPRAPRFREDAFRALFDRGPSRNELPSRTTQPPAAPNSPANMSPSPAPANSPARSALPAQAAAARSSPASPAIGRSATTIDFNGIRERISLLPTGLDVSGIRPTPDGKALLLTAAAAREENLYLFPVDDTTSDPPVAKQLTSTLGHKTDVAVSPDGKVVYYNDAGTIWAVSLDDAKTRRLGLAAEFDVDFGHEKRIVFAQAWSLLDRWYADPHFHGADWPAIEREYAPRASGARTPDELRRVISLMLGELNSSHLGIGAPRNPALPRWTTGRLGAQWDPARFARAGRLRIAEIVPLGPLALTGDVGVGDEILGVDGAPLDSSIDIDALLANRIGKRTTLSIAPHGDSSAPRTVAVLPVDTAAEQQLLYRSWVNERRAYVERRSAGRLGYVHLYDMSEDSLARFYTDLDVANRDKDGVIIDVRNNEGGFVDPYALDVLTRREYLRFRSRFGGDPPERTALGQRALDKPTVLVVNEHSLSDAENFTAGYRALRAGPIVGEPTAGWIIFTSSATLADGSTLRLPTTRVFGRDGVELELHPRPVDIRVANPPGAQSRGDDPQLDAAVRELSRITANQRVR